MKTVLNIDQAKKMKKEIELFLLAPEIQAGVMISTTLTQSQIQELDRIGDSGNLQT